MTKQSIVCAACAAPHLDIFSLGGLRRASCRVCHHSQRIDVEPFDYSRFAMGGTGLAPARLAAQAEFILARLGAGGCALEIGCAAGDLAAELRRRTVFSRYDGIEFSPAREIAAARMDRVFSEPLDRLLASGKVETASYNIVLSSHCLEHVDEPSAMVAAMRCAVKADGLIFLETPNRSGHAKLAFDDNRSHVHFFGLTSLTYLLARHGLEIVAAQTGARLDARYSDSLRVLARPYVFPEANAKLLSDHPALAGVDKVVVWGAGRMVEEMLAYYFDRSRIAFFIDKDAGKQGAMRLGAPVFGPQALEQGSNWTILVNSLEMESSIRAEIDARHRANVARVVGISELLD